MKKIFLITSFIKIKYKSGAKLLFVDEYLQKLYKKEILKKYKYSFANDLNHLQKYSFEKNLNFKKKLNLYRKELSKQLNQIHNTKKSQRYWGFVLDYFLIILINNLQKDIRLLKNAKKKAKNIFIINSAPKNFFYDTESLNEYIWYSANYQIFTRSIIGKQIGIKALSQKNKEAESVEIYEKTSFLDHISKYINVFFRLYVYMFKPILILDASFGFKNSVKFFLKSRGKIFCIPSNKLFSRKKTKYQINKKLRSKFKIKERDFFDKIFNLILYNLTPTTYLEGYDSIVKENSLLTKSISKIGGGTILLYKDKFKFLAAEILSKKGKLLAFQHGGGLEKLKYMPDDIVANEYATKRYLWTNKKGLGQHFLTKYKKTTLEQLKKNKKILIYPTQTLFQNNVNNLRKNNHPILDQNYDFFENLKPQNKNNVLIKLFPMEKSKDVKKIWEEKFKNVNFTESFSASSLYYYNSRIVILNDISTPLFELMYIGVPFILITDNNFCEWKEKFAGNLRKLEKLKILHRSPVNAAKFINDNYENIFVWWNEVLKNRNFINFKKNLFFEKTNYEESISRDLINV